MAISEKKAARWERTTKRGKALFILQNALYFFVLLTLVNIGGDYLSEGKSPEVSLFDVIFRLSVGVLMGFVSCWIGDGQYKDFLLDQKIKKGLRS